MAKERRTIPTARQLEALKWVYFMVLSHKEAAIRMGIGRQGVTALIRKIGEQYPDIKALLSPKQATPKKKISYDVDMDYGVWEQF